MAEEWMALYRLALVELQTSRMQQRITDARSAILTRLKILQDGAHAQNDERRKKAYEKERQAIEDALNSLRLLEREHNLKN